MERCTACRARLGASPICPRCGCDFTLAMRAETQARRLLGQALQVWAAGEPDRALDFIAASLAARRDPLALALAALLRAAPTLSSRDGNPQS